MESTNSYSCVKCTSTSTYYFPRSVKVAVQESANKFSDLPCFFLQRFILMYEYGIYTDLIYIEARKSNFQNMLAFSANNAVIH